MKPVEFKYQNIVFAKDQPEYQQLPALKIDSPKGEVVSCWRLSFKERIKVLIFGKVWMSLMSFNKPLTPSYLAVDRKDVFSHPDDAVKWWKKYLNLLYIVRRLTFIKRKTMSVSIMDVVQNTDYSLKNNGGLGTMLAKEQLGNVNIKTKKPKPTMEEFGWYDQCGFDDEPSGWIHEGGEEAYYEALKEWEKSQ